METLHSSNKPLEYALEQVRTNPEEAAKFASDPEGYLHSKGVSTEGLHFGELEDSELDHVSGGRSVAVGGGGDTLSPISTRPGDVAITICGSVGCIACLTVGN